MSRKKVDIQLIKNLVVSENIVLTEHFIKRLRERSLKIADILNALSNGEIIENYPSDYPYPSCLVLGYSNQNKTIHVVCGYSNSDNKLWLITAYEPNTDKWHDNFRTRK